MFSSTSRYAGAGTYEVTLPDGRVVTATAIPLPAGRTVLGWHRRREGERLDLIAHLRLGDATAFWRLCEANNAMVPAALEARELIAVPPAER